MLLNPLYFKFVVRNEIQPGELKKENIEIQMTSYYFKGSLVLYVFCALLVFKLHTVNYMQFINV